MGRALALAAAAVLFKCAALRRAAARDPGADAATLTLVLAPAPDPSFRFVPDTLDVTTATPQRKATSCC
jgi:hypothetical protein